MHRTPSNDANEPRGHSKHVVSPAKPGLTQWEPEMVTYSTADEANCVPVVAITKKPYRRPGASREDLTTAGALNFVNDATTTYSGSWMMEKTTESLGCSG